MRTLKTTGIVAIKEQPLPLGQSIQRRDLYCPQSPHAEPQTLKERHCASEEQKSSVRVVRGAQHLGVWWSRFTTQDELVPSLETGGHILYILLPSQ